MMWVQGSQAGQAEAGTKRINPYRVSDIVKSKLIKHLERRKRNQPTVPEGFKEKPFVSKNSLPAFSAQERARGFMLFKKPITQSVYLSTIPLAAERLDNLTEFASQGEYRALTFSVYPLRNIKNMRIDLANLKCGENSIAKENIDLRLVTSWNIRFPRYTSYKTYRCLPELLEKINVNSFKKGKCQRYWLTIHIPNTTPPGIYTGNINVFDELSPTAVSIPVALRVLGYKLQRDPAKRYSVYYNSSIERFGKLSGTTIEAARANEYRSMLAHGIDMLPTVYCNSRKSKDGSLEIFINNPELIDNMLKAGLKGPLPVAGGIRNFYNKYVPGAKIGRHWSISKMPENDDIYKAIEKAFRKFRIKCEKRAWPELFCCPIDEMAASSAEFGARVYAAIRKAGLKTYITKNPLASDASIYLKYNAVNAWCSQPFAMPYKKLIADSKHEYWCYPNHNAGEIKDRVTMQKGGRMTYGFGLWRSGYTTLIPWHWRWITCYDDPFDYLRGRNVSGCGMRIDEKGEIIPAVYWECFREGYNDARYIYTLQQALFERQDSRVSECVKLLLEGKKLIQQTWDSIIPQAKYMNSNMWADEQFDAVRWQMAELIEKLKRFPITTEGHVASVTADTSLRSKDENKRNAIALAKATVNIERFDIGGEYNIWKEIGKETNVKVIRLNNHNVLRMETHVDHKIDGENKNGSYPIGWPRIRRTFRKGDLNILDYDYLLFNVKVDSDRDEVSDDSTPLTLNFYSHDGARYDMPIDIGGKQRVWIPVRVSIKDMIARSGIEKSQWQNFGGIQFVISESKYADGTKLIFDFDGIELLKFKQPLISRIECPDKLIFPAKKITLRVFAYGVNLDTKLNYKLLVEILDRSDKTIIFNTSGLNRDGIIILDIAELTVANYKLVVSMINKSGKAVSTMTKDFEIISGYLNRTDGQ